MISVRVTFFIVIAAGLLDGALTLTPGQEAVLNIIYKNLAPLLFASDADIPEALKTLKTNEAGFLCGPAVFSLSMINALKGKIIAIGKIVFPKAENPEMFLGKFLAIFDPKHTMAVKAELNQEITDVFNISYEEVNGTFLSLFQRFAFGVFNCKNPEANIITKSDFTKHLGSKFKYIFEEDLINRILLTAGDKEKKGITIESFIKFGSQCYLLESAITMIDEGKQTASDSTGSEKHEATSISIFSKKPKPTTGTSFSIVSEMQKPSSGISTLRFSKQPKPTTRTSTTIISKKSKRLL